MTSATPESADLAAGWLRAQAEVARAPARVAAYALTSSTVGTVMSWAALCAVVQAVVDRAGSERDVVMVLLVAVLAGGVVTALGARSAARARRAVRGAVVAHVQEELVRCFLPDRRYPLAVAVGTAERGEPATAGGAADAAGALLELAGDVADYHAEVGPLHRAAPASMLVILAAIALVHWPAALILVAGCALMPLNMRIAGLAAAQESEVQLTARRRLAASVLDSIRGMSTLRAVGAQDGQRARLHAVSREWDRATMQVLRKAFLSSLVMNVVVTFAIAVAATYIGFTLLGYVHAPGAPALSLGGGLFVLVVVPLFFLPLRELAAGYHRRDQALAAAAVLQARTADRGTRVDVTGTSVGIARPARIARIVGPVSIQVAITVDFGRTADPVISRLQATFEEGTWTVVTGPTGTGKTTLLAVVAGLVPPDQGVVSWVESGRMVPAEPEAASWIGQRSVLIEGTIAENIALGRTGSSLSTVATAARSAGLDPVLARLPDGLHTRIGDGGWGLSAGEGRRVSIARALLKDSGLWLLDEPTAHLDPVAEHSLLRTLREVTVGRTVVVATHAPAVVALADQHLHLERPRPGPGAQLMRVR